MTNDQDAAGARRDTADDVHGEDLAARVRRPDATDADNACYILKLHEHLLRNMTNEALGGAYGQEAVHTAWAAWTGMTLHNMPDIGSGTVEVDGHAFMRHECAVFVEYAARSPVPARWHPGHPGFGRGVGRSWRDLCDHVARVAGVDPAYGVPSVADEVTLPRLPRIPNLGFADKFLPAPLKEFLKAYAETLTQMPEGTFSSSRVREWMPESRAADADDDATS